MKKKNKKYVIVSQRLLPEQINELSMCCIILNEENLDDLLSFVVNNGGRVISAIPCFGVSRFSMLETINALEENKYCVFIACQKEITDILLMNICREFEFMKTGHGKAFCLDVLGYMGAKGLFIE